jgi:hypothetical protein
MRGTILVFVQSGWFVMTLAVVGFGWKNVISDAIIDHGMSCPETIIM